MPVSINLKSENMIRLVLISSDPSMIKVNHEGQHVATTCVIFTSGCDYMQAMASQVLGDNKLFETLKDSTGYSHIFEELEVNDP